MLTRQYRFATRGIEMTVQTAHQAIGIAGQVVGEVADRLGLRHGHGEPDVFSGEVMPEPDPRADPAPTRAPEAPTPPAPAPPTASAPSTPPAPSTASAPAPAPAEPSHVSREPELVEEVAEPGAEDGAGAQIHVREPWPGYRSLKARDLIARLPSATREELATVELYELAHANRKSVVVAAQRALKKASPPR
jgi:hypothetical protein